jgi:hypothetical protein
MTAIVIKDSFIYVMPGANNANSRMNIEKLVLDQEIGLPDMGTIWSTITLFPIDPYSYGSIPLNDSEILVFGNNNKTYECHLIRKAG